MKPSIILLFPILFVISCKLPEKPAKAKAHIVKDIVEQAAEDSLCPKVTPILLGAVAHVESRLRPNVARFEKHHMHTISATWDKLVYEFENATSHGEYQILGSTSRAYKVEPKEVREDRETSVRLAALHLGHMICDKEKGDVRKGLIAWNAGEGWRKKKLAVIAQAASYAQDVLDAMPRKVKG
jgi:soluble lytic murein transglycosylase-like protein